MSVSARFKVNGLRELRELLRKKLDDMRNLGTPLARAATLMYQGVMKNFRDETDGENEWAPLSPMTLALRRNKNKSSVKILQNSGYLRLTVMPDVGKNYVSVGTNVAYGWLMQRGGKVQTPEMDIYPRRAKALRFMVGGQVRFARHVHIPSRTATVPARPFITMTDNTQNRIVNMFLRWVEEGLEG